MHILPDRRSLPETRQIHADSLPRRKSGCASPAADPAQDALCVGVSQVTACRGPLSIRRIPYIPFTPGIFAAVDEQIIFCLFPYGQDQANRFYRINRTNKDNMIEKFTQIGRAHV